jgi:hypothetical protein
MTAVNSDSLFFDAVANIKSHGYHIIKQSFNADVLQRIKQELNSIIVDFEPPSNGIPYLNRQSSLIYNPDHKSLYILHFLLREDPFIHGLLKHFLNDPWYRKIPESQPNYVLRASIARSSSSKALPLHIDSFVPSSSAHVCVMQILYCVEESSSRTGATVVVPGSHLSDRYASQDALSSAIALELKPGDVAIWDSRLWHGALPNTSSKTRWALVATYTRWWIKQNYQKPLSIPRSYLDTLTRAEKTIIGVDSYPPFDEYERIDIKSGYSC